MQPLLQWKSSEYYTTWVCVFVALGIQHAMPVHHVVICCLPRSTEFFHIISWTARISKKSYWIQNVCFDFLYIFCLKHFSFWEEFIPISLLMCIGLRVKYPLFLSDFNETWISSTDFRKITNIKFPENPSSGSQVPCGRTKYNEFNCDFSQFCERAWQLSFRGHKL